MTLQQKYEKLIRLLRSYGSAAVAYSGGVDSTLLLLAAREALGDQVLAITAESAAFPEEELEEARGFCREWGILQISFTYRETDIEGFAENPPNRCYLCKRYIFSQIERLANEHHMKRVVEGSNLDDEGDYRPGRQAVKELGVASPLLEAELTKEEIRLLSKEKGLLTWQKPAFACLATRFVYGERITEEKLKMVGRAEQLLREMSFGQVRVRMHGQTARIEIQPEEFDRIMQPEIRECLVKKLKELGFIYVTLDLQGYRTGSMNEPLSRDNKKAANP